ncbi:MAG: metal ABC transporter permease [Phycisphaerales bacterium]|nr:metal ABC transporter permease [Phycisphaerales bacterium]
MSSSIAWLDYNTQVVAASAALLGAAAGLAGCLLLLRRRALMGDALGHATLPGIAGAYLVSVALGGTGKEQWVLLAGAAVGALGGVLSILVIRRGARVSDETAMAIVLGSFFGFGTALLTVIQATPGGHQAGLSSFILGHAASMVASDLRAASIVAFSCAALVVLLTKELRLLCFDDAFARAIGRPVRWLDGVVLLIITAVVIAGLQAVGLILILALLILPATAARLCTDRFSVMLPTAAVMGAVSGVGGTLVSASAPRLPTGPCIVLFAAAIFALALLFAPHRGLIVRATSSRVRGLRQ